MTGIVNRLLFLYFFVCLPLHAQDPWTWVYQRIFDDAAAWVQGNDNKVVLTKTDIPPFTQLIFSWNAVRPEAGFFRFKAKVRDAQTKKWHDWHTMMEWGAGVQRSFLNKSSTTNYHHVRLELPNQSAADGLTVMVEAHHGAPMHLMRALFVSVANLLLFEPEKVRAAVNDLPSVFVQAVPLQSQMILEHPKKEVLCSPTSCSILTSYLLGKKVDPLLFAECSFDEGLQAYGSWPFNTAHAFEHAEGKFFFKVQRLSTFRDLHALLAKNIPVVVSVRGPLKNSASEYANGHLLVVVGWDSKKKKVICHDPAFAHNHATRVSYDVVSFLAAWERSRRLAYCAEPAQ